MSYKKFRKYLRTTTVRELFFTNYLRLIKFMKVSGVYKCRRNNYKGGGFEVHNSQ